MKGVLFSVIAEAVEGEWGADTWDDLLADAGLDGVYTSLGNYPDADLDALVAAAAARFDLPPDTVVRTLGRLSFVPLAQRYPAFLEGHRGLRDFLPSVNRIIHPEVLKLYPGASVPAFEVIDHPDGAVDLVYDSVRGLCVLAEGLALGAADHYGEAVEVTQPSCRHRGDATCTIHISGAR